MVSDEEFVTKTSKGEELDGKKAPGRTGAERTGKMSRRACYFEGWAGRGKKNLGLKSSGHCHTKNSNWACKTLR